MVLTNRKNYFNLLFLGVACTASLMSVSDDLYRFGYDTSGYEKSARIKALQNALAEQPQMSYDKARELASEEYLMKLSEEGGSNPNSLLYQYTLAKLQEAQKCMKVYQRFIKPDGTFDEVAYKTHFTRLQSEFDKVSSGSSLGDVVMRGIAGPNWKALEDFRADGIAETAAAVVLFSGAKAFGGHLEQTMGQAMGNGFDAGMGMISTALNPIVRLYRSVRNVLLGRSGEPFNGQEVEFWRSSVNTICKQLVDMSKNADKNTMRSADKIARDMNFTASSEWECQLHGYIAELSFIVLCLDKSIGYYSPEQDRSIVHYATQLRDAIAGVQKTILEGTNSSRDLGSNDRVTAIRCHAGMIDQFFNLLAHAINPRSGHAAKMGDAKNQKSSSFFGKEKDDEKSPWKF